MSSKITKISRCNRSFQRTKF